MARGTPYKFQRFGRGLNTLDGVYALREGYDNDPANLGSECRDALNAYALGRGAVRKRGGSTALFTRANIKDFNVVDPGGSGKAIYSTTAGALYQLTAGGTESTLVASGLSASAPWVFRRLPDISSQGPYYGMNGTDTPRQVTTGGTIGTWTASTGSVPNGTLMVYAGNRVFVAGASADPYAVYFSAIGDPTAWPSQNVIEFEPKDGQPITGLGVFGPYVLVFKKSAIYVIYDTDNGYNRKLTDQAGTESPRSIVSTSKGTYFLDGERGVMVTDGLTATRISVQIQPTLNLIAPADRPLVTATFVKDRYYMAARLSSTTRRIFDYDTNLDSWWLHSQDAVVVSSWDRGTGTEALYCSTTKILRTFLSGVTLDDGIAFPSYWSGPFHAFSTPHLLKRCRRIHFDGEGVIDVYVQSDFYPGKGSLQTTSDFRDGSVFGGSGSFGGAGTFGSGLIIGEDQIYSLGIGRVWSVSVGNQSSQDWELDSYTMLMDLRKD